MYKFSERSKQTLETCHKDLQNLFEEVIKYYDCTIISGYRNEEEQNELFRKGLSKKQFPGSKHNASPALAVDVAPYPIDWNDYYSFYHFAGFVCGVAKGLGLQIRWGGDWDSDNDLKDQSFMDLGHFEIHPIKVRLVK